MTSTPNPTSKLTDNKKGGHAEQAQAEAFPRHEDNDGSYMIGDIRVYPLYTVLNGVLMGRRSEISNLAGHFAEMREHIYEALSPHQAAEVAEVARRLNAGRTS